MGKQRTHFVLGEFDLAAARYTEALSHNHEDYYARASLAQCVAAAGNDGGAKENFRRCLEDIIRSGDFRRKRERSTRVAIGTTAAIAAIHCGDQLRTIEYMTEVRELLAGNLSVGELTPKFLSQMTKRLVTPGQLIQELEKLS